MQKLCAFILYRILGWRIEGRIPLQLKRALVVYLPHTSNWDFLIGILFVKAESLKITIFGKDQFYFFPISWGYRYCRVVPIKRNKRSNFVEQAAALYNNDAELWTAMAPEGTRSKVEALKSGYYYFAKTADIPIVVVGLDFKKKALVISEPRAVEETFEADMQSLLAFSHSLTAKYPEFVPKLPA